ncbi:HIRAN domain-containing protein [Sphingomonas sp. AX6]|uniref:HIRAN domain-containing protein n=1 Tax=Sphingomonas sp. AX6 TaxID=2653171 RepID=UPI00135CD92A
MCEPGEPVELRAEPNNPADEHAVAVYSCRGIQIGYVTTQRAPRIAKLLRETEVTAIFQHHAAYGAVIRAAFGGEQPSLAGLPSPVEPEPEPEFWPDPDWPD